MLDFHMLHRKGNLRQLKERYFLPNCSNNSGGGTQTFFIPGRAILALNIAPINPAALPKKDTHKSGKQELRKALTTEHEQGRKNYFEAIFLKSIPINLERA